MRACHPSPPPHPTPPHPRPHAPRHNMRTDCSSLPLCSLPLALAASQMPAPAAVRLAHVAEGTKAK